jgi:hypothetical protein
MGAEPEAMLRTETGNRLRTLDGRVAR